MDQLMALVPIEAATSLSTTTSKGRRSRWERSTVSNKGATRFGPKEDKPYNPPPFVDLPPGLTPLQMDQFLREQRLEELSLKLEKGELEFGDPDIRPPSPPPAYDRNGTRTNMRETRVRNAMLSEHQRLIEYMAKTVLGFIPPNDFKPVKKIRRIIIPQEKYPEYNFMGLIIGPRGCNHKRLESESGAQISIRGRGTQKEGKKTDHQTEEEAGMPQHIHIAADTEESLDKAVSLIEPLLNPFHPAHEEFKKKGLEQLALVNGVSLTKIDSRCTVCGAVGHLSWECPDADFQSFQKANVKCGLCGDKGHVTMDCKLAKGLSSEELAEIEKRTQGIQHGGPQHFGGGGGVKAQPTTIPPPPPPPPPPPRRQVDPLQLDMEFSQMMSEISRGKDNGVLEPAESLASSGAASNSTAPMVLAPPILGNQLPVQPNNVPGAPTIMHPAGTQHQPSCVPSGYNPAAASQTRKPHRTRFPGIGYVGGSFASRSPGFGVEQLNGAATTAAAGAGTPADLGSGIQTSTPGLCASSTGIAGPSATANGTGPGMPPPPTVPYTMPWNGNGIVTGSDMSAPAFGMYSNETAAGAGGSMPVGYYPTQGGLGTQMPYMMDPMAQWTQQMSQMFAYYPNMLSTMMGYGTSGVGYGYPQQQVQQQSLQHQSHPTAAMTSINDVGSGSAVIGALRPSSVRAGAPPGTTSIFSLNAHNYPVPPKDSAEAAAPLPPPPAEEYPDGSNAGTEHIGDTSNAPPPPPPTCVPTSES